MSDVSLILASASPRRRELLAQIGVSCDIHPADIEETVNPGESGEEFVARMALEKAQAVASQYPEHAVLAADTVVLLDDEILGKPVDRGDVMGMLARLSGREHTVVTAVCLVFEGVERSDAVVTRVQFDTLTAATCEAYLATDEPWDKAGAYAIQGLAGALVRSIDGSYSNVVGLPLTETWHLLSDVGVPTGLSLREAAS